jgi:hypothetical protein
VDSKWKEGVSKEEETSTEEKYQAVISCGFIGG